MKHLIVARHTGFGLDQDARILQGALAKAGIDAETARPRDLGPLSVLRRRRVADRIIHLERIHARWLNAADEHFLIPNQERFPPRMVPRLKRIDRILAKTRHALENFSRFGRPATYLGFASDDCRRPETPKDWSRCLHLAGRSTMKGTEDLIAVWARHPDWPELVIVQDPSRPELPVPGNVTVIRRFLEGGELRALQNGCGIHLCPSRAEGWGHYIAEAMSAGALVVTTDAPPMNELVDAETGVLVAYARSEPRHLGTCYFVDEQDLERRIETVLAMPDEEKARMGEAARQRFEANNRDFETRIAEIFGGAAGPARRAAAAPA